MKHINKIEKNPPIKTYLHYALPLSIICAHNEYVENIYNMFVQLVFAPDDICPFDFHELNYQSLNFLKVEKYNCFKYNFSEIIDEIKKNIINGFYYIFWTDCFYINNEINFNENHAPHGFLIYGFDEENDIFYCLGYRKSDGTYGDLQINGTNLYNSIISPKSQFFQKISFDCDYWAGLYIPDIEEKYRHYIKSTTYDLDDFKFHPKRLIKYYGINASKEFSKELFVNMKNCKNIDPASVGIYVEHKLFFCMRTRLIITNLENKKNLLEKIGYLEEIEKMAKEIKLLFIRYSLKNKKSIPKIINEKMNRIHQMEESVINIIINVVD